jgi:hypothetical protein
VTSNQGDPKVDALNERDLARYFEERKDDETIWQKKGRKIRPRRGQGPSTVFTLRLAPEELTALLAAANARNVSLTEFIRTAALTEAQAAKVQS